MNENEQSTSGAAQEHVSGTQEVDHVAYETYSKVLGEAKKVRGENRELKERLDAIENQKLQAEGKKDEVISNLQNKIAELNSGLQKKDQVFGWSVVENKLKQNALEAGCTDLNAFMSLVPNEELDTIKLDEKYNVDIDSVSGVVSRVKDKYKTLNLFGKPTPNISDKAPNSGFNQVPGKDRSKMSTEELIEEYKRLGQ